jgi:hypothetical protein
VKYWRGSWGPRLLFDRLFFYEQDQDAARFCRFSNGNIDYLIDVTLYLLYNAAIDLEQKALVVSSASHLGGHMKSKRTLAIFLPGICCIVLSGANGWMKPAHSPNLQADEAPEVIIMHSPNSPLEIVTTKLNDVTSEKPEVEFTVKNKNPQPIIAYAIRYEAIFKSSRAGGSVLINAPSMSKALRPGETSTHILGNDVTYSEPIKKIYLYVDYAQIADGTSWGPDKSKAFENLAGQRAAALLLLSRIRNAIENNGTLSALEIINGEEVDLEIPQDATPRWKQGFRTGIAILKDRLRRAYNKDGFAGLETEASKPFDAAENRR